MMGIVKDLHTASARLRDYVPRLGWGRRAFRYSAVAIVLREGPMGLEALMIKRAEFKGDPWSGHMAFPGGRRERRDHSLRLTAARETREEIGLDLNHHAAYLGRLSDVRARLRQGRSTMVVSPHVWAVAYDAHFTLRLTLNHEVAEVLWVPLDFLADTGNCRWMRWKYRQLRCFWYQERHIWGLSLKMLDELLAVLAA